MANLRKVSLQYDDATSLARKFNITGSFTLPTTNYRGTKECRQDVETEMLYGFTAHATQHLGFRFTYESLPSATQWIAVLLDGSTTHLNLGFNTSGQLVVANAGRTSILWTGTTVLAANTPYYVEWSSTIANSGGTTAVYLNGSSTPDATAYSGDTLNGAGGAQATVFRWGLSGQAGTWYFRWHDFYHNDGLGSAPDNTRWGDTKVFGLLPTADGHNTGLTPSTGTDHYALVDDAAVDDDTTYVAGTSGKDTYVFPDWDFTALTVHGASLWLTARKGEANALTINGVCRSNAADYDGTAVSPSTSYLDYEFVRNLDPDTAAAWTQTALQDAEWGPKIA